MTRARGMAHWRKPVVPHRIYRGKACEWAFFLSLLVRQCPVLLSRLIYTSIEHALINRKHILGTKSIEPDIESKF